MQKLPKKFTPGNFKLRIGRSDTGKGLFTERPIAKGACVIEYIGRPVVGEEQYTHRGKYLFETSKTTMIDGGIPSNRAKYINHSCRPNCEIDIYKKRVFVLARRAIKEGEELTYDYGREYFNAHIKPRGCKCAKCQGA